MPEIREKWITIDRWFRMFTTLTGINIVDTCCLSKFHNILPQCKMNLDIQGVEKGRGLRRHQQILHEKVCWNTTVCTQILYKESARENDKNLPGNDHDRGIKLKKRNS